MKKASILLLTGLLFGLFFAGRLAAQANSSKLTNPAGEGDSPSHFWLTTRLTSPSQIGGMSNHSLALDTAGQPHILYGEASLYYTWRDATTWHQERLDGIRPASEEPSALALDSANTPHIVYIQSINYQLVLSYATRSAGRWLHQTLDQTSSPQRPAIAIDDSGRPHIVYGAAGQLRYLHQTGQGWSSQSLDADVLALSLTLDQTNHPHIAYITSDNFLRYATWDGAQWQLETVQPIISYAARVAVSIALDSQGQPAIAYQGRAGIRYTARTEQGWTLEHLNNDAHGSWLSLALDSNNTPHLSYYDSEQDRQMYATRPAATWNITIVDNEADSGHFTSLALDQQGQPHISYAYYDYFEPGYEFLPADELRYAHLAGGQWLTETASVGSYHRQPFLAINDNDQRHLLYEDLAQNRWHYAYETQNGWATETITITSPDFTSAMSFALDVASNPHIAYFDFQTDLRYASRSNDVWSTQIVTTGAGPFYAGPDVSLALDDNQLPHLAYYHHTADELQYAHLDGDNWVIETVEAGIGSAGGTVSLALDSLNQPHLAYQDATNFQLKYAHYEAGQWFIEAVEGQGFNVALALDSQDNAHIVQWDSGELVYTYWTGSAWSRQLIEELSQISAAAGPSLVFDQNDHLYIAYQQNLGEVYSSLKFAYHDGNNWFVQEVDTGMFVGNYPSLALNSQAIPFIVHQDWLNGHIKLSRPATGLIFTPLILKP